MCSAQDTAVPFQQIEHEAKLSLALPSANGVFSSSIEANNSSVAPQLKNFTRAVPGNQSSSFDAKYLLLNGLHLGAAVLDVEMTQHCIANHTCREGNPLMPSSHIGQLSVNFAFVGYGSWISYRLKRHHSSLWWVAPTVGASAHMAGAATGIAHY
jgi:hypothetical protein